MDSSTQEDDILLEEFSRDFRVQKLSPKLDQKLDQNLSPKLDQKAIYHPILVNRPIHPCGTIPTALTRCQSTRMRKVLSCLHSNGQFAFSAVPAPAMIPPI